MSLAELNEAQLIAGKFCFEKTYHRSLDVYFMLEKCRDRPRETWCNVFDLRVAMCVGRAMCPCAFHDENLAGRIGETEGLP